MDILAQRGTANPAFVAPYDFTIGIPGLSGLHAQVDNNFLSWNAAIVRVGDSLKLDPKRLLAKTGNTARIVANVDAELLRFTWRRGRNNFSVGAAVHADVQLVLGKESLSFLLQGPGAHVGNNHLAGNKLDMNSYGYMYFGYSRVISRKLSIGGRFKLIQGLWNMHTENLDIYCDIQNEDMSNPDLVPYQYRLSVDGRLQTNLPINNDFEFGTLSVSPFRNMGAALDFGVSYDFLKNWNFSASVLDLGFIVWNDKNTGPFESHRVDNDFQFKGLDYSFIESGESLNQFLRETGQAIWDTLGFTKVDTVVDPYTRCLPASFNLSLSYTLRDIHTFGLLFKGQFYHSFFSPEVSVSYTCRPGKNFAVCVSNTFCRGNFLNFGAAFVVNMGPLQLHLGVDRINSFNVAKMRTLNVNFGLNLVFGKAKYDWYTGRNDG